MSRFLLTFTLVVASAGLTLAQNPAPHDLTGTWVLNVAKSKQAKGAEVHSETVVITISGSSVIMRYTTDGKEWGHTYVADGKEHPFAEAKGGEDVEKAYWKKSAFVTEMVGRLKMPGSPFDGAEGFHTKDRWTLSADGRVLTDESEGLDRKTVSVYDKQ